VTRLVVLLRGINVGRHKRIAMPALRELLGELGYEDVRTHLQSGNALVSTEDPPDAVARAVEDRIRERLGFEVDVVVRTADELAAIVESDPLGDVAGDGAKRFVLFLSAPPDPGVVKELERRDFGAEAFAAGAREVYAWCPDGLMDSPLMKALNGAELAPVATARNWNTVTRLLELAHG
jgi:uncharacterized protein (DUF1697 family)